MRIAAVVLSEVLHSLLRLLRVRGAFLASRRRADCARASRNPLRADDDDIKPFPAREKSQHAHAVPPPTDINCNAGDDGRVILPRARPIVGGRRDRSIDISSTISSTSSCLDTA